MRTCSWKRLARGICAVGVLATGCGRFGYELLPSADAGADRDAGAHRDAGNVGDGEAGVADPFVQALITATPQRGVLNFRFDASDSRTNDGPLSYAWEFGDGDRGSGASTDHAYAMEGTYSASVTVTSASGLTDTASVAVPVDALRIVELTWWNALSGTEIGPLTDGQMFDLYPYRDQQLALNIQAHVAAGTVGSVVLDLQGTPFQRTENGAPYFLVGDIAGAPSPWSPLRLGAHRLSATAYAGAGASGTAGPTHSVDFELVYSYAGTVEIAGFVLVDPATDMDVGALNDLDTIDLSMFGGNAVNIRVDVVPPNTGGLVLGMVPVQPPAWGAATSDESVPPYSVAGDNYGDFQSWMPTPGTYTLTARPFSQPFGGGVEGTTVNLQFDVL